MARFSLISITRFTRNICFLSTNKLQYLCLHKSSSLAQNPDDSFKSGIEECKNYSESKQFCHPHELKLQILNASLQYVPECGWSKRALSLGAQTLGFASVTHGIIQDGGIDLVHYFNFSSNKKLDEILKDRTKIEPDLQTFLENTLESRLQMVVPYVSKWPEAMALMMLPTQLTTDSKNLLDLVNIIWHYSGEKDLSMQWYSRRLMLAATYKMCELSLIQDKSPDYADTVDFLHRRVEMIVGANKLLEEFKENTGNLSEVSQGAFIMVRNLLGLNKWLR